MWTLKLYKVDLHAYMNNRKFPLKIFYLRKKENVYTKLRNIIENIKRYEVGAIIA